VKSRVCMADCALCSTVWLFGCKRAANNLLHTLFGPFPLGLFLCLCIGQLGRAKVARELSCGRKQSRAATLNQSTFLHLFPKTKGERQKVKAKAKR